MGTLKWYQRDPRAALTGMMGLTLEERGAYNTVLDLIYCHDGAVEDDEHYISGFMQVNIRTWRRLRLKLLSKGKLYVHGTSLRNERADEVVAKALTRVQSAAIAGLQSASKRGYGVRKINGMQTTTVQRTLEQPTTTYKDLSANIVPLYGNQDRKEEKNTSTRHAPP